MKSLIVVFFVVSTAAAVEVLLCTPNFLFQRDTCHECTCSEDGKTATCSDKACPKQRDQMDCEPGQPIRMDDFSTCVCNKNRNTVLCTWDLQAFGRSRNLTKSNQFCTPQSMFSPDNCNTCVCSKDGLSAVCTRILCEKTISNSDGTDKILIPANYGCSCSCSNN